MRSVYILIPFLAAFLCACETDPFTFMIGTDQVVTTTKLTLVDTISVSLSTYKKDSIQTSGMETALAGTIQDEVFGDITAISYFQIGMPVVDGIDDDVFDSITLVLKYNQYYAGDTLQQQAYNIFQLAEELEEDEDYGGIYNTSSFAYGRMPVGTVRFDPHPNRDDKLEITLDDKLGEDMLSYLQENNDIDDDDFLERYQGFVLAPVEGESQSVLGFTAEDSCLYMKIYSHEPGPITIEKELELKMTNSNLQYNQIIFDLDQVQAFDTVTEKIGVPASSADDLAYIYGGMGLYTRVSFPYLQMITGESELMNSILVNATLYLDPTQLDFDKSDMLNEIDVYTTEQNGDLGDMISGGASTTYLDELFPESSYFSFDLTDYVNYEVEDYYLDPEFGFYLDFSDTLAAASLDKLMLNGASLNENDMRLELTFFHYDL